MGTCFVIQPFDGGAIRQNEVGKGSRSKLCPPYYSKRKLPSKYFNKRRISGHLWQGLFCSCVLDEPHLMVILRYVEKNTVRTGIVEKAWQWEWSSAAVHIGRPTEQCPLGTKAFKPYN